VIALPPSLAGAVNATVALALPPVAVPIVGAPGAAAVAGVTLFEAADAGPVPTMFVAATVKLYAVPPVRPATVIGLVGLAPVKPPGLEIAV
jgi:hypothetical protein